MRADRDTAGVRGGGKWYKKNSTQMKLKIASFGTQLIEKINKQYTDKK